MQAMKLLIGVDWLFFGENTAMLCMQPFGVLIFKRVMRMTAKRSLLILLLIVLATSICGKAGATDIETDYYRAFVNTDGSLNFTNKSTGATILSNSPKFYLNYGATTSIAKAVPNNSFEIDNNHDNIPDNWTVDKTYIRLSTEQASDGNKSLKFNATAPDVDNRRAYSSLITITQDAKYTISIDSYVSSFTLPCYAAVYAYYYETVNGTGTGYLSSEYLVIPTAITGSWVTTSFNWTPPISARSFKVNVFMSNYSVATIYLDNVSVVEKNYVYASNGSNIVPNAVVNGDTTTITATDDSNPYTTVNHQYELNTHSPYINYTATFQYKQDVFTTGERFDFVVPSQNAQVMTRDLQLTSFNTLKAYWSDIYTPKVVRFANGLSFLGSDTMESMRLLTSGSNSQLSFYSDYKDNHPHFYYIKNGGGASTYVSETQRSAGDTYSASVTFAIDTNESLQYLVKTRQPYGYDAVLTFTNHPDYETLATIKAVAYGTQNGSDPNYGTKGITSRGLGWTKGVFVWGETNKVDLNEPNYKALIDHMYQDGVEIVGHSIRPYTDSREIVAGGLATLSQYNAIDWIDHDASDGGQNWEDLASQGAIKGDDNFILDLLDQYNYQYAWSYIDLGTDNYALNILRPSATWDVRPFLFYNNRVDDNVYDNKKIYLWSTIFTKETPDLFYTNDRVNTLISERGVHISHEYFGYSACENHVWYNNNGTIQIYPPFDAELAYIASKRAAGLLWSPPMVELGNYLVPLKDVLVSYNSDGTITVTNNSLVDVTGITLLAENNIRSVTINNYDLVSFGDSYGDKEMVLPTIASGGSVVLDVSYGAKDSSVPTIVSNDTGKNKVNEITGYWDDTSRRLTMTAKGHNGNYSFTVTIPSLANKTIIVKNVTLDTIVGEYNASGSGTITFTVFLDSLYTFKLTEQPFVSDLDVDNFNSYGSDNELQNVWRPHPSLVQLNTNLNFARDGNSMKFEYQEHAEVELNTEDLPYQIKSDWTVDGAKALVLYFYGDPCNSVLPMYMKLKDGSGKEGVVTYGDNGEDPNDLRSAEWHEWNIDLANFDACGVDLIDVEYVYLGFGSGTGSGTLYFDGIRLYPPRCVLSKRSADFARVDYAPLDSNGYPCGDCVVDYQELEMMADYWLDTWLPIPPSIPNLVAYWSMNEGYGNKIFTDPFDSLYTGTFSVTGLSWATTGVAGLGSGALQFDGSAGARVSCGNDNPASEANELTLAIWAKWLGPRTWDPYLYSKSQGLISKRNSWSPSGLQFMFECDTPPNHRGSFSLRQYDEQNTDVYSPNGLLNWFIGQWVHLAVTFDGTASETACKLYLNGNEVASGPFFFGPDTVAGLTIGNTNDEDGWDSCPESFNGYLDEARIYNRALTADEIGYLADQGRPNIDLYSDCVGCQITIDLKDFAVLANYWLEEKLWP